MHFIWPAACLVSWDFKFEAQWILCRSRNHWMSKCVLTGNFYSVLIKLLVRFEWASKSGACKCWENISWCLVMLMLHYVQEVSYFKNLQVLGEWSVAPTNKCSSEMKAALLPSSYVEKVGQCTWGKNLLLLCSHPSNSVLIVTMNTFKLAVHSSLLQMSPTTCHGSFPDFWFIKSPLRIVSKKLLWIVVFTSWVHQKKSAGLLSRG